MPFGSNQQVPKSHIWDNYPIALIMKFINSSTGGCAKMLGLIIGFQRIVRLVLLLNDEK